MGTKIEWTEETWNPIIGCSKVSPGCQNCYAERMAVRLANIPKMAYYQSVTCHGPHQDPRGWNGKTHLVESALDKPFRWKKPRTIFVCSMSDLFHSSTEKSWIDKVFAVASMCPQHTFLVLTKRPERMVDYFSDQELPYRIQKTVDEIAVYLEMNNIREEWRDIPGFEGEYQASTFGNIRSMKAASPKLLTNNETRGGYYKVSLSLNGNVSQFRVHRLILATFIGDPDHDLLEGCHRNGNVKDNRIANLSWGTRGDNMQDASRHGTAGVYMKSQTKFTKTDISKIRSLRAEGMKLDDIAVLYNSNRKRICKIVNHQIFKESVISLPLPNIMLGVTAENQEQADKRIPILLQIPAAKRFVSIEPMLSAVDISEYLHESCCTKEIRNNEGCICGKKFGPEVPMEVIIDWVICGAESGPGRREMHIDWAIDIKDQCVDAGVPFFFKQKFEGGKKVTMPIMDGNIWNQRP